MSAKCVRDLVTFKNSSLVSTVVHHSFPVGTIDCIQWDGSYLLYVFAFVRKPFLNSFPSNWKVYFNRGSLHTGPLYWIQAYHCITLTVQQWFRLKSYVMAYTCICFLLPGACIIYFASIICIYN